MKCAELQVTISLFASWAGKECLSKVRQLIESISVPPSLSQVGISTVANLIVAGELRYVNPCLQWFLFSEKRLLMRRPGMLLILQAGAADRIHLPLWLPITRPCSLDKDISTAESYLVVKPVVWLCLRHCQVTDSVCSIPTLCSSQQTWHKMGQKWDLQSHLLKDGLYLRLSCCISCISPDSRAYWQSFQFIFFQLLWQRRTSWKLSEVLRATRTRSCWVLCTKQIEVGAVWSGFRVRCLTPSSLKNRHRQLLSCLHQSQG